MLSLHFLSEITDESQYVIKNVIRNVLSTASTGVYRVFNDFTPVYYLLSVTDFISFFFNISK